MGHISTIITSYNNGMYLAEAIESVLNQTFPCYELIIVDDDSSDGSQDLIRDYEQRYPQMIRAFLHEKNLGIPRNRNFALERVQGTYVSILDGDDRFLPYKNEIEMAAFEEQPMAGAVYSNVIHIDHKGTRQSIRDREMQPSGSVFNHFFAGKFGVLRSMLIRYSALCEIGFMDVGLWGHDGFDLSLRLAQRHFIQYIPDPLVEYRIYPNSNSKQRDLSARLEELNTIYMRYKGVSKYQADKDEQNINLRWSARIFRLQAIVAKQQGRKLGWVSNYIRFIIRAVRYGAGWKQLIIDLLPSVLKGLMKRGL